jgi:predicted Zn-dependent protease
VGIINRSQKFDSEIMEVDDANEKYCPECWEHFAPILAQEAKEIRESEI